MCPVNNTTNPLTNVSALTSTAVREECPVTDNTQLGTTLKKRKISHLQLPPYMFSAKFNNDLLGIMIGRLTLFLGNFKKAYVIIIKKNHLGENCFVIVTQNNSNTTMGFPGGRITVNIKCCPSNNGANHSFVTIDSRQISSCILCGIPDVGGIATMPKGKKMKLWKTMVEWVETHTDNIVKYCMETTVQTAVREVMEETGIDISHNANVLEKSSKIIDSSGNTFFVYHFSGDVGALNQKSTTEIAAVGLKTSAEVEKLIEQGKFSVSQRAAYNALPKK